MTVNFRSENKVFYMLIIHVKEAVVRRCSVKRMLLEISRNSHENTCARDLFLIKESLAQVFSCEFCEISKNTFFYRKTPVAASDVKMKSFYV